MPQPASRRLATEQRLAAGVTDAKNRATHTGTQPASTISDFAAAVQAVAPGGSAPSSTSTSTSASPALGLLAAGLASATYGPCALAFCGDSVTEGYITNGAARRWVNLLTTRLQAAYPSGLSTETAMQTSQSADFARNTAAGVHGYNAGHAATIASTYIGAGETAKIAALAPAAVFHAVGTNDYRDNRNPATYKVEVVAQLDALEAALTTPSVHVLVHYGEPAHGGTPTYPWTAYGTALAEIAAARPTRVAYLDLAPAWAAAVPSFADPLDLYFTDNYHPNDRGHAFIAELVYRGLRAPIGGGVVPIATTSGTLTLSNTAAPTITGAPTTGQTLTVSNGSWSAAPDSYTRQWYRSGVAVSGATGSTHVLTQADEGQSITCAVTAVKAGYTSATATSVATSVVAASASGAAITESWTGSNGATWPAGWSVAGTAATIQDNRGRMVPSSYWAGAVLGTATGGSGDFDAIVDLSMTGNTGTTAVALGVGAATQAGLYTPNTGYTGAVNISSNGNLSHVNLYRNSGGSQNELGFAYVSGAPGTGNAYTMRVQRVGNTVQVKVWPRGAMEPTSWALTHTDGSPISGAFKPFVGAGNNGATVVEFDNLSVSFT